MALRLKLRHRAGPVTWLQLGLASVTGGGFYRAMDRVELANIYRRLDAIETRKIDTMSFSPKRELFWLPLLAMTIFSMLAEVGLLLAAAAPLRRPKAVHP